MTQASNTNILQGKHSTLKTVCTLSVLGSHISRWPNQAQAKAMGLSHWNGIPTETWASLHQVPSLSRGLHVWQRASLCTHTAAAAGTSSSLKVHRHTKADQQEWSKTKCIYFIIVKQSLSLKLSSPPPIFPHASLISITHYYFPVGLK